MGLRFTWSFFFKTEFLLFDSFDTRMTVDFSLSSFLSSIYRSIAYVNIFSWMILFTGIQIHANVIVRVCALCIYIEFANPVHLQQKHIADQRNIFRCSRALQVAHHGTQQKRLMDFSVAFENYSKQQFRDCLKFLLELFLAFVLVFVK